MASSEAGGDHVPEASSFVERLMGPRSRDLSMFLPFFLGFTNPANGSGPVQEPSGRDQESQERSPDRVIFVNPFTQGMVVIESTSSTDLESLFGELISRGKDGQPPASKSSIEAMPCSEIGEDDVEGECVVCLEEWQVGQKAKEMPCKHKFHGDCIEKWLKIHGSCPICRYNMPADDDQDLNKKNENENENRGRRRDIWVSFSFGRGRRSSEENDSNETNDS